MDNKFLLRLRGKKTDKAVVEIQKDDIVNPLANMPASTEQHAGIIDDKDSSVVVAQGSLNWKWGVAGLTPTNDIAGNGADYESKVEVAGSGLWINSSYTFPTEGTTPNNRTVKVFTADSKWVLKLCGANLYTVLGKETINFTLIVKIGTRDIAAKDFDLHVKANGFCKKLVVDFSESAKSYISARAGQNLTLQLICNDADASATLFQGMTVLTVLERKVEATAVASRSRVLEDFLEGQIIPSDFFSNPDFIEQIADKGLAFPVFVRNGDDMEFVGWGDTGLIKQ